ncbi:MULTISPECIES: hypothetical protein [Bacillus cereus group]|uniref:hypothetical protein n=1 Tax=Bacillus cereus group TaxID=86661 RepID=UPI000BF7E82C|nr:MULTISPECIES: hypothetical protein [Bacillus cereus group]MBD8075703.1 hypothetical protein [Bacillus thuringiensis]MCQ6336960.1 hypothetical protein [Bacillus cereus]MCU4819116.1 hypothetical protein [Bacillus cereus]MED2801543.1 hypothetical protein [Bacillus thuringiensis]PFT03511.1 hypothetical protein COK83_32110 [Bacillus thuringiensis]
MKKFIATVLCTIALGFALQTSTDLTKVHQSKDQKVLEYYAVDPGGLRAPTVQYQQVDPGGL